MTTDEKRTISLRGTEFSVVKLAAIVFAVLIALLLPFIAALITSVPYRSIFNGLTLGFAAVGVALLLRHLHLVSFGHAAFFGSGAYTVAVLANHFDISNIFVLLLGGTIIAGIVAVIIGGLVKGHLAIFFALLTLAFNQIIYSTVRSLEFFNFDDGLGVRIGGQRPDLFGVQLGLEIYNLFLHYLTVFLLIICLFFVWKVSHSPFGRTISAIGQNRTRAKFIGINVERYVFITFFISAIFAGIGGSLWALYELHVRPGPALHVFRSGEMLFMAILGGIESIVGPVVGSVILSYLLDTMHIYTEYFNALTGVLLILIVFLLPNGLGGINWTQGAKEVYDDPTIIRSKIQMKMKNIKETLRDRTRR